MFMIHIHDNCIYSLIKGATLDKKGASVTWDSKSKSEESFNADRLHLRQILLGHTANEDEYNVVEVSIDNNNNNNQLKLFM